MAHRIIQQIHETQAEAIRRFELESGATVGPDDLAVIRAIVEPAERVLS